MAIYKRGNTWWTDFSVNGQRFRESLDTTDWREAQAQEKELIVQASQGKLAQSSQKFARLPFSEAADRYIADRLPHLSASSITTERERLKPLRDYFAAVTLISVSSEVIREYVARRKEAGISNRTVNLETGVLRRILKRARLWQRVADDIKPLPERRDVGRAMSKEEKVRLTKAAGSKPEWQIARLAMELALNTTMRACEIRGLLWRDIDFLGRNVTVRRSKTEAGERVIPLNAYAWAAILELRERAKSLSGENISPDWFLFPHAKASRVPIPLGLCEAGEPLGVALPRPLSWLASGFMIFDIMPLQSWPNHAQASKQSWPSLDMSRSECSVTTLTFVWTPGEMRWTPWQTNHLLARCLESKVTSQTTSQMKPKRVRAARNLLKIWWT
jgi:integrase